MWIGMSVGATAALFDATLAPQLPVSDGDDRALAEARTVGARRGGAARLRTFERDQRAHVPAYTAGLCADARAFGHTMTDEQCAQRARETSNASLVRWLRALANAG